MCGPLAALRLETRKGTKAELPRTPSESHRRSESHIGSHIGRRGYDRGVEAIPEVALRWPIIARTWLRVG